MPLYEQIKTDLTRAQKEQNARLLGLLRLMVSELKYKEIDTPGALTDAVVVAVLQKEAKKRQEAIEIYTKVGDTARSDQEKYELEVIKGYMPSMMAEAEVEKEVDRIAAGTDKRGGQLVGMVMGQLRGKADGTMVARLVNGKYGQ